MLRLAVAALLAGGGISSLQDAPNRVSPAAASQPASKPATRTAPRGPEQARILEELLRGSERRQVKPILSKPVEGQEGSEEQEGGTLLLEGTVLIERAGTLVRGVDRSEFRFKSAGAGEERLEPMEFNKNSWLELMEAEADAGVREFVITAEVTRYHGRNYLLLRKFRRYMSNGNGLAAVCIHFVGSRRATRRQAFLCC
jgi:hypothetical protein